MGMTIKRRKDDRAMKCILHRTADIPGGVGVSVSSLGGSALFEGTPLGKGENGLYAVCKTAKILAKADNAAVKYEVAKGHHFKAGDYFAVNEATGKAIKSIDTQDPAKDVITLSATLGVDVNIGDCAFESKDGTNELKVKPIAIAGSSENVESGENLFVSAWVIGVVREANAPAVNEAIKSALKGVVYV